MEKTSKLGRDGAFWGLVMVAPTIIGLIVLNIYPFIDTIYMRLFQVAALSASLSSRASPTMWRCSRTPSSGKRTGTPSFSAS